MANGVALPLPDALRDVRTPVRGNDPSGMVDLMEHGYVSRSLHNLQLVVVVDCGKHRDSFLAHQDAALLERPILVAV